MKLAKKVLAIVMALGLIACMSAMAFATSGSYYATATTADKGENARVTFYASYALGLASGTVTVKYDPAGVMFNYGGAGAQAKAVNDAAGNGFSYEINDTASGSGSVVFGFFFTDNLWDAPTFAEKGEVEIDDANFDIAALNFKVLDPANANVTLHFEGKDVYGGADSFDQVLNLGTATPRDDTKKVDSIPDASKTEEKKDEQGKPVEETKAEAADAAKTNTGAKTTPKTDGGKNTGDNGVIAVVAGVIALAGAAFVVTKKRK